MPAHRLLLVGVSPIPHREFFGPMKNTEDVVEIKETTVEAFKTMLNYIYIPSKSEKLSPKDITRPQFLQDRSDLAPDVTIHILCNTEDSHMKSETEEVVSAHRWPLTGVSHVFRKLFFGPMKNTEDVVEIKETTLEAFKTMINYIYTVPKFSLKDTTCPEALLMSLTSLKDTRYQPLSRTSHLSYEIFQSHRRM